MIDTSKEGSMSNHKKLKPGEIPYRHPFNTVLGALVILIVIAAAIETAVGQGGSNIHRNFGMMLFLTSAALFVIFVIIKVFKHLGEKIGKGRK